MNVMGPKAHPRLFNVCEGKERSSRESASEVGRGRLALPEPPALLGRGLGGTDPRNVGRSDGSIGYTWSDATCPANPLATSQYS